MVHAWFGNGRIRFRRGRFQTPSSVRFLALTELRGENSVSSPQPIICVPKWTHRVSRRTHRVCGKTQWGSVSSLHRNSVGEDRFLFQGTNQTSKNKNILGNQLNIEGLKVSNPGSSVNDFRNKTLQKQAFGTVIAHLLAGWSRQRHLEDTCAKFVFQGQVQKHYVYNVFCIVQLRENSFLVKTVCVTETDDFWSGRVAKLIIGTSSPVTRPFEKNKKNQHRRGSWKSRWFKSLRFQLRFLPSGCRKR